MLKITRIETVYPAPADEEEDYCPDGETDTRDEEVTFRELVDLMREHSMPSCSYLRGNVSEWFSTESYQDPYTGEYSEQSIHFSHDNPPRMRKYWKAAMKAAGFRVRSV